MSQQPTSNAAGAANSSTSSPKGGTPSMRPTPDASDKYSPPPKDTGDPADDAVLEYLRKKGMGNAVLELTNILRDPSKGPPSSREQLEMDDAMTRNQRTLLARTTGGGFGYDTNSAPSIAQWGVPDSNANSSPSKGSLADRMGQDEAQAYLNSFTSLQLWVLSLPDDPAMVQPTANPVGKETNGISIAAVAKNAGGTVPEDIMKDAESLQNDRAMPWMPPSTKPELLAVTFALFVQTYCELLEVGMESTAHTLLGAFRPVYEPLYAQELAEVEKCKTTDDVVRINSCNSQHLESLATLKAIMVQVANFQTKKAELEKDNSPAARKRMAECDQNTTLLQQKYQEIAKRATTAFGKMKDYPFLRRARAVKWQITLSASSYAMLASYLSSQESLLSMSALLQAKCELHVERRDPLPYTPACVLDDGNAPEITPKDVHWAAPVPPAARLAEAGEDILTNESERLPFPRLHLDMEFDEEVDAEQAKKVVEFNRALLLNGFRRLEALERKREYEIEGHRGDEKKKDEAQNVANPLKPSILQYTLCSSSSSGPVLTSGARIGSMDSSSIWDEPGIGITCAKMCYPDGRRVAAGCDDAAVRIWSMYDSKAPKKVGTKSTTEGVSETGIVLLGHKNGFPVFDVDWNRDGRTLLSAGGDGSVRLWDTMVVGPYGSTTEAARQTLNNTGTKEQEELVPGLRPESSVDTSGAALAVYRGHSPSCPIWSVAFAPSGYYFATGASDATSRIWTTDRPMPVRILSGHTSSSVNTVTWHPNCNYVLTGCDDRTVRMWDVQNGRCVRLLTGCGAGINVVRVCPSGRYAAGSDYSGIVHIWDLGSGKKVNELRPPSSTKRDSAGLLRVSAPMIHSLSYSACGTALATGGDDCVVRVWDVRGVAKHGREERPGLKTPSQSFPTARTSILDLQFTKRNLLMSLGKYTTPVPLAKPVALN